MQHMKHLHEYPDHHWHSRKNSPGTYSSTTVLIQAAKSPEAQGTVMGLPRLCTPAIQAEPPSLRDEQITSKFAAGIGELREGSVWMTITAWTEHYCARSLWLYQFTPKTHSNIHSTACPFGLQHKHTPLLNPGCWITTVPDESSQWQKGFWKVTLLDIIILLSM